MECPKCGAELRERQIPCPENRPGCLVYHFEQYCDICDRVIFSEPEPDPFRQLHPLSEFFVLMEKRLDMGAKQYGDGDYWGKDIIGELMEELLDVAVYAYLEYLKLLKIQTMLKSGGVV